MEVSGRKVDEIVCEPCSDNGQKLLAAGFCVDCCEFLCIKCYKHHCRARVYRSHVLQDEETMPRTKPESITKQITSTVDKCPKHQGEIIKYYCRADRQLGCGSCMITNHRRCEELLSIKEEYEKFDKEIQDFGLNLDKNSQTKNQNCIEIEKIHSQAVKDIKLLMNDIKEYFENLENKMITDVDKVKNEDKKKMESIYVTNMTLTHDLQSLTSDLSNLHQSQQNGKLFTMMEEARDQMKTIAKDIDGMSCVNKVLKYTFMPEKQIKDLIGNVVPLGKLDIDVEPNSNVQTEILESSDEVNITLHEPRSTSTDGVTKTPIRTKSPSHRATNQTLTDQATAKPELTSCDANKSAQASAFDNSTAKSSTISTQPSDINNKTSPVMHNQSKGVFLSSNTSPSTTSVIRITTDIKPYQFKPRRISKVSHITFKSLTDKERPWITGIVLLPNDQLVLVDGGNDKVKLVNTKQNKMVAELELWSKPWDIAAVNNNVVAITTPYDKEIHLVSVSNSNLSQGRCISVKRHCYGLVYCDEKFIITYSLLKPGTSTIEIISMTGNVLKVIDKGQNGETLFENPQCIALSPDNTHVYISDGEKHTVTCMTLDGKVKGFYKYGGLRSPHSLTVDKSGSVYVLCGGYSTCIYQISDDCSQGLKLKGSEQEGCLCSMTYCNKEEKLYQGYCGMNSIRVFQLK